MGLRLHGASAWRSIIRQVSRWGETCNGAARRAADALVLEDAERLIGVWNEHQARRMPLLFAPTIGAALAARYWFLWVRCPACRTTEAVDCVRWIATLTLP